MQTYLTQMSYSRTFADLTEEDLLQQISDAKDLLMYLVYEEGDLSKAPARYMWQGYESALVIYGMFACIEWTMKRGYHSRDFWVFAKVGQEMQADGVYSYETPPWFRDKDVIRSHRSTLMRRNKEYGWTGTPSLMPVIWPVVDDEGSYVLKVSKADKALLKSGERKLPKEIAGRIDNL